MCTSNSLRIDTIRMWVQQSELMKRPYQTQSKKQTKFRKYLSYYVSKYYFLESSHNVSGLSRTLVVPVEESFSTGDSTQGFLLPSPH